MDLCREVLVATNEVFLKKSHLITLEGKILVHRRVSLIIIVLVSIKYVKGGQVANLEMNAFVVCLYLGYQCYRRLAHNISTGAIWRKGKVLVDSNDVIS